LVILPPPFFSLRLIMSESKVGIDSVIRSVGVTGSVPRLGFRGFCLQDGPLGIRYTDHNSAFPAGMNAAATWSKRLMRLRGEAMGEEFYGKGIDVQLGPAAGPLGRVPQGGRNWEGFR